MSIISGMDWIERITVSLVSLTNFPDNGDGFYAPLHIHGSCFCPSLFDLRWPYKWVFRNGLTMSYPYVYIYVAYYTSNSGEQHVDPQVSVRLDLINFHKMEHQIVAEQLRHTLIVAHQLGKRVNIKYSVLEALDLYYRFCGHCNNRNCSKRAMFATLQHIYNSQLISPRSLFDLARTRYIGLQADMNEVCRVSLYQRYLFESQAEVKARFPLTFACVYAKTKQHIPQEHIPWRACDPTRADCLNCFCKSRPCMMECAPPKRSEPVHILPCSVLGLIYFEDRTFAQKLFGNVANILRYQHDDPIVKDIARRYNFIYCTGRDSVSDYFDFIEVIGLAETL